MDTDGIYDDLPSFDFNEEMQKLRQENEEQQIRISLLEKHLIELQLAIEDLKTTQATLSRNLSELFKTAKAELERKDRMIAELRSQIDDLVLKRNRDGENHLKKYDNHNSKFETNNKRSRERSPVESGEPEKRPRTEYYDNHNRGNHRYRNSYNNRRSYERPRSRSRERGRDRNEKYGHNNKYNNNKFDRKYNYAGNKGGNSRDFPGKNSYENWDSKSDNVEEKPRTEARKPEKLNVEEKFKTVIEVVDPKSLPDLKKTENSKRIDKVDDDKREKSEKINKVEEPIQPKEIERIEEAKEREIPEKLEDTELKTRKESVNKSTSETLSDNDRISNEIMEALKSNLEEPIEDDLRIPVGQEVEVSTKEMTPKKDPPKEIPVPFIKINPTSLEPSKDGQFKKSPEKLPQGISRKRRITIDAVTQKLINKAEKSTEIKTVLSTDGKTVSDTTFQTNIENCETEKMDDEMMIGTNFKISSNTSLCMRILESGIEDNQDEDVNVKKKTGPLTNHEINDVRNEKKYDKITESGKKDKLSTVISGKSAFAEISEAKKSQEKKNKKSVVTDKNKEPKNIDTEKKETVKTVNNRKINIVEAKKTVNNKKNCKTEESNTKSGQGVNDKLIIRLHRKTKKLSDSEDELITELFGVITPEKDEKSDNYSDTEENLVINEDESPQTEVVVKKKRTPTTKKEKAKKELKLKTVETAKKPARPTRITRNKSAKEINPVPPQPEPVEPQTPTQPINSYKPKLYTYDLSHDGAIPTLHVPDSSSPNKTLLDLGLLGSAAVTPKPSDGDGTKLLNFDECAMSSTPCLNKQSTKQTKMNDIDIIRQDLSVSFDQSSSDISSNILATPEVSKPVPVLNNTSGNNRNSPIGVVGGQNIGSSGIRKRRRCILTVIN